MRMVKVRRQWWWKTWISLTWYSKHLNMRKVLQMIVYFLLSTIYNAWSCIIIVYRSKWGKCRYLHLSSTLYLSPQVNCISTTSFDKPISIISSTSHIYCVTGGRTMLSWLPAQSYTRQYYLFILSLIVSEPHSWVSSVWCLVCITRKRRKAPFLTMLFHFCMLYWTPIKHKKKKKKKKTERKQTKTNRQKQKQERPRNKVSEILVFILPCTMLLLQ